MRLIIFCSCMMLMFSVKAQKVAQLIEKGNEHYKKKEFVKANNEYNKAIEKDKTNAVAQFNSGNAKQQLKKYEEAGKDYEAAASGTNDPLLKSQAFYNLGLSFVKQKKLNEAIDAFKKSLRLNPEDNEARQNLQKALKEQKQQQQKNDQQDKNRKKSKEKDQKQQAPKSGLKKEEAEKMFNNLSKDEKNLQKDIQKKNQSARQLKDW
jgi:Ca-activated chloride channel homolog